MSFKKGDRVIFAGKTGTITEVTEGARYPYRVVLDSGGQGIYAASELKKAEQTMGEVPLGQITATALFDSEFVWIKMGAAGEYEKFNTPYEAGSAIAKKIGLPRHWARIGFGYQVSAVNIGPDYVGHNRISLFWGDGYGHWIRDLSPAEQKDFERGLTT